ncbi:MAG: glycosyltransferase family 8 protein [Fibrobacter sp.]|nr:glycosyltransferase family 8 protein [Fibrobacter sp.]
MEPTKIPVALASDGNQIHAMATVITSAIINAHDGTFYDFYCLISSDVSEDQRARLKACEAIRHNCVINLVEMDEYFKNIEYSHNNFTHSITTATLFRLKIPSVLTQIDKLLYIDTDIIVRDDLSDLYNFDMGDSYLAGVPAVWAHANRKDREKWLNRTGIPEMDYYVNAGVLIMNLKEMRANDIEKKCFDLIGYEKFKGLDGDQLILNYTCYGRITFLPCKYNVTASNMKHFESMRVVFSGKEISEAINNPTILHWTGAGKPWKYYDVLLAHEWWRYYKASPYKDVPLHRESNHDNFKKFRSIVKKFFH